VLNLTCYDVIFVFVKGSQTFQGHVIALSRSRCEDYFLWMSVYQGCNLLSRIFHCYFSFPSVFMSAGVGIAIEICLIRKHFIKHSEIERSCRLKVQIDTSFVFYRFSIMISSNMYIHEADVENKKRFGQIFLQIGYKVLFIIFLMKKFDKKYIKF